MAQPYLGEVRLFSFNFPPRGWAHCNGQLLPIAQNQPLFSLLGTTYGGNGQSNFALPNLQGRMPMHAGNGFTQGQVGGAVQHTLSVNEMPPHAHAIGATPATGQATAAQQANPMLPAAARGHYAERGDSRLHAQSLTSVGAGQAHENMPPYLALNFCMALNGIFPSRN